MGGNLPLATPFSFQFFVGLRDDFHLQRWRLDDVCKLWNWFRRQVAAGAVEDLCSAVISSLLSRMKLFEQIRQSRQGLLLRLGGSH